MRVIAALLYFLPFAQSFQNHFAASQFSSSSNLLAGKGWDNSNYLDSLGGSEEDISKANQEYKSFSKTRQAFLKRQLEYSKTEAGKRALEYQKKFLENYGEDSDNDDDITLQEGSSRFAAMMQQAKRKTDKSSLSKRGMMIDGFEQKFAVPLDDDDEENSNNDDDNETK